MATDSAADAYSPVPAWRAALGLRAGREWWGLEPPDLRCRKREHGERNVELLSRHAGERSVLNSSTSHAHSHRKGLIPDAFYRIPTAHAEWGEEVPELHDPHGLFGDCVVVALIHRAGFLFNASFLDCSPHTFDGREAIPERPKACFPDVLFVLTQYFLVMWTAIRNWSHEVEMKSRFYMNSHVHMFCDFIGYFLLLKTTVNFASPTHDDYTYLFLHTLLWWVRWLEIALFARRENERRYAGGQVVDGIMPLVLMTLVLRGAFSLDASIRIWTFAQIWTWLREFWRHKRRAWLSGPHWPLAQTTVPTGIKFMLRRQRELLMLTLGEVVVGVAVFPSLSNVWELIPIINYIKAVRYSGYVLVVGMLYMLVLWQPDASHDHPFSRGAGSKILYRAFLLIICTILPLVGTMLELAIHYPLGFHCRVQTGIFYNLFSMAVLGVLFLQAGTLAWAGVRDWWWHRGRCRTNKVKLALWTCRNVLIFTIVFLCKGIPPYSPGGWWTEDGEALIPIYMLVVSFAVIVWLNVLITHLQLRESEAHPNPSGVPAEPAISLVQSPLGSPGSSFTHGHGEQAACTSGDSGLPLDAAACCSTSRSVPASLASVEMPADNPVVV